MSVTPESQPAKERQNDFLNERQKLVLFLRESEKQTYKAISEKLGVGVERARQIYFRVKRLQGMHLSGNPYFGLRTSIVNVCRNKGLVSREQILQAIKNGSLHPSPEARCRNFGWKSYAEVHKWLGIPEPLKRKPKTCPNCGHEFH